jgi:uncharacterized protein (TIGR03437 family)
VPSGGTAQITVTLASPVALTHGRFTIDLDPAVFGNISAVNVFSASGDQEGAARLDGLHADVMFGANSGGIGRLPNMPVAEITAPVLVSAPAGVTGAVKVQSSTVWHELSGKQYTVSVQSPGVPIGAGMSIRSVVPGGGKLAAGTVVAINGQGFTNSTKLQLDGVAWSNPQVLGPTLLNITLTGATDLTGKLFQLTDSDGASTRYYSSLTPASVQDDSGTPGFWPIFPAIDSQFTGVSQSLTWWFENDTSNPIDVLFTPFLATCTPCAGQPRPPSKKITIPEGGLYLTAYNPNLGGNYFPAEGSSVSASGPLRVLRGLQQLSDVSATTLSSYRPTASMTYSCPATSIEYRVGDPQPPPIMCQTVLGPGQLIDRMMVGTDDGNPWAQISAVSSSGQFSVSIDPSALATGPHLAVVTSTLAGGGSGSITLGLNVNANATITADQQALFFDSSAPREYTIHVTSNSVSAPITVRSSDPWLAVTPASATTPATLTAQISPSAPYYANASVTIQGPANSIALPAGTYLAGFLFGNPNIVLSAKAGSTAALTSTLTAASPFDYKITTDSGGNWLTAAVTPAEGGDLTLTLTANPSGLARGIYHGTLVATPTSYTVFGMTPVPVLVTLSIWSDPVPAPAVSPATADATQPVNLTAKTGSVSAPFSVTYEADDGLTLQGPVSGVTPQTIQVNASALYPGRYNGSVTITAPPGSSNSVTVPLTVTASPAVLSDPNGPRMVSMVNAASLLPGSVAPGEIVSVFGLFPAPGTAGASLGSDGKVNRAHYGIQVLFNGVAAPLIYTSSSRIDAVVPYEIAASTVTVEIDAGGVDSPVWGVPVAQSAPGLFGILNQDNSPNTPETPASRGSIVQIFLTGEGATTPAGITGEVTGLGTKTPIQAVSVQIGGADAKVVSATTAPDAIAGLFQVNVEVPAASQDGAAPVIVRIGGASSQAAATVSVH